MKKSYSFILVLILMAGLLCSCHINKVSGDGNVVSKEIPIKDYDEIQIEGENVDFKYMQSDDVPYLKVETDQNIMDLLDINTDSKVLVGQSRALRVQHEHDGTFRPLRDLKGARARGIKADAVVIAHHALDDRHVLPCAVLRKEEAQRVVVKKEGVQIAALRADDLAVEHGVNVIGTALRRGDRNAAVDKRLQDRAGHRRLAAAAVRSGNEQSRRCPLHGLPSFCNLYKAFLLVCATAQIPMC